MPKTPDDDHPSALLFEFFGRGQSDAAVAACDDGDFIL
jgi:hypothetical protein